MGITKNIGKFGGDVLKTMAGAPRPGGLSHKTGTTPSRPGSFSLKNPSLVKPAVQKTATPQPVKDDSIFKGGAFVEEGKMLKWAEDHADEIYRDTNGRVTRHMLPDYVRGLGLKKFTTGGIINKGKVQSQNFGVMKDMRKRLWSAKDVGSKIDVTEDKKVVEKMLFGIKNTKK